MGATTYVYLDSDRMLYDDFNSLAIYENCRSVIGPRFDFINHLVIL